MRPFSITLCGVMSFVMAGCGGGGSSVLPSHGGLTSARHVASVGNSYTSLVTNANPIAYYRLNDNGSTMADSGPNSLGGVYGTNVGHGGALIAASGAASIIVRGAAAGAPVPDNTGTVTTNALFATATSALTVEAWIKPAALNTTNHYVPIVSYGREIQGQAWVMQETPQSTLMFWMKTATTSFGVHGTGTLAPGLVYHVVATYDGVNASVYMNGTLQAATPATGSLNYSGLSPSWGLGIGGALGGAEPIFNGAMSDVAIYSSALAATTVQSHYLAGSIAPTPAPTAPPSIAPYTTLVQASNPVAFYKLNDTTPSMTDSSVNQLTGAYGLNVVHGGGPLTSTGDSTSVFPGSASGADIPSNSGTVPANPLFTTPTTNLTVEAWIKPAAYNRNNSYESIVAYGRQTVGAAWTMQVTPQSTLTFFLKTNTSGYLLAPTTSLTPGQIYHAVATYNGSTLTLYVNGLVGSTMSASGAINYSGIQPQWGLGIGAALGGSLPIFNGTISDVALYSSALSAAAVQQHYVVGLIEKPLVETPSSSDAFVDSIGVVTHLRTSNSPYTNSFPTFESLIVTSGIRHIGDTLISIPAFYPQELSQLASAGIHASLIANAGQTAQGIVTTIPAFQGSVEAIEGLNEPDISGDPNWVADTRAFQQMLYSTVKGNPATASLPVVGPSMVTEADDAALGDLSSYMDYGSMHDYFGGFNPGTTGWGNISQFGIYGSLTYNLNICALVSGNKPVFATETGYSNLPSQQGSIDSRTLARYAPRTYLEHFLRGVARTTTYEFYDEPGNGNFANFGLVDVNNNPKSSYYAIQSLIKTLADPGATFSPRVVSYYLTGNMNSVHHLLLQKRDGTYELAMWVEAQGYNPTTQTDMTVLRQTVTLQPAVPPTAASIATIGDSGTITQSALNFTGGKASFSIDDHVTIVSFK
jgi:hypothetical protein